MFRTWTFTDFPLSILCICYWPIGHLTLAVTRLNFKWLLPSLRLDLNLKNINCRGSPGIECMEEQIYSDYLNTPQAIDGKIQDIWIRYYLRFWVSTVRVYVGGRQLLKCSSVDQETISVMESQIRKRWSGRSGITQWKKMGHTICD